MRKVEPQSITTLYVGPLEITINASTRITKTYYSAGAQMVAMRVVTSTGGNTLYYLHTDHLGSTSLSTCGSGGCGTAGALVPGSRQSYYPYGAVRTAASSLPTDISFTGQRKDASTGLMFYNARYYDPVIGRFVSADTIVPNASNPQSLNRFSYVRNNPLRYTDPTGHREECGDGPCPSRPAKTNPYGVRFTADEGQSWDAADKKSVLNAAGAIARGLRNALQSASMLAHKMEGTPRQRFASEKVFRQTFGQINFHRSATYQSYWAETHIPQVTIYSSVGSGRYTSQNAAHELGHAFSQRAGAQPYTDLNSAEIVDNVNNVIAGGGGPGAYARTDDGYTTAGLPWQQHRQVMGDLDDPPTANEDFADMFLGWAYNNFAQDLNGAGSARYSWMSTNMSYWIALATN